MMLLRPAPRLDVTTSTTVWEPVTRRPCWRACSRSWSSGKVSHSLSPYKQLYILELPVECNEWLIIRVWSIIKLKNDNTKINGFENLEMASLVMEQCPIASSVIAWDLYMDVHGIFPSWHLATPHTTSQHNTVVHTFMCRKFVAVPAKLSVRSSHFYSRKAWIVFYCCRSSFVILCKLLLHGFGVSFT